MSARNISETRLVRRYGEAGANLFARIWCPLLYVVLIAVTSGCTRDSNDRPEDFPRLSDVDPTYQEAATRVATVLKQEEESPSRFFAQIEEKDELLIFHLWHESAFLPANRNTMGNPGGKNRTIEYDQETGEVSTSVFWQ